MFQALQPLVAERAVHLLISSSKDGRLSVYVEPSKIKDDEDAAFVTPFRAQATAAELDAQFPAILSQWIASRQANNTTLAQQLAEAEATAKAAAEEAKKKIADKHKKPTVPTPSSKPTVKVEPKPATPSLLDDLPAAPAPVVKPVEAAKEPVAAAPVEATPVAAPTETTPVEVTPAAAPVVTAPVETAPVVTAPAATTTEPTADGDADAQKNAPVVASISTEATTPDLWG